MCSIDQILLLKPYLHIPTKKKKKNKTNKVFYRSDPAFKTILAYSYQKEKQKQNKQSVL